MYCLFSVIDVHLLFLSYVNLVGRTVGFFKGPLGVVVLLGPPDFRLCVWRACLGGETGQSSRWGPDGVCPSIAGWVSFPCEASLCSQCLASFF